MLVVSKKVRLAHGHVSDEGLPGGAIGGESSLEFTQISHCLLAHYRAHRLFQRPAPVGGEDEARAPRDLLGDPEELRFGPRDAHGPSWPTSERARSRVALSPTLKNCSRS